MSLPPLLVPFVGMCLSIGLAWVEVGALGLVVLPLVYVQSFLLGASAGLWWHFVGSRR